MGPGADGKDIAHDRYGKSLRASLKVMCKVGNVFEKHLNLLVCFRSTYPRAVP